MPFDGVALTRRNLLELWLSRRTPERSGQPGPGGPFRNPLKARVAPLPSAESPPSPVVQVLQEAKDLIESPENWVTGIYKTSSGMYCAVGALRAAAGGRLRQLRAKKTAHRLLMEIAQRRGFLTIEWMNDSFTHRQVLAAFIEAMARATTEEAVGRPSIAAPISEAKSAI